VRKKHIFLGKDLEGFLIKDFVFIIGRAGSQLAGVRFHGGADDRTNQEEVAVEEHNLRTLRSLSCLLEKQLLDVSMPF
jgi:hypothetical protein